jgi:hypothetical protein
VYPVVRSVLPLLLLAISCTAAAADPAPAGSWTRPAYVDSVKPLPDGAKEIVVSGGLSAPDGTVQTVHLGELLKQAAIAECNGATFDLKAVDHLEMNDGPNGPKFTLKGTVRCKAP